MSVVAIADLFGAGGGRQELKQLLQAAEAETAALPGCLRYAFAGRLADPDHILLVSEWRDHEAMKAHYKSDAFARFQRSLDGLLVRRSEMTIYEVAGVVRPVASGPLDPRDAD
jgi:quinol monooxygenase YgiN